MRSALLFLAALALAACARTAPEQSASQPTPVAARSPEIFAEEIARFEAADRLTPPKPGGVLFVGSSSIRLWPALEADFPGVDVLSGASAPRSSARGRPAGSLEPHREAQFQPTLP